MKEYTILDVLQIVKTQLATISVSGQNVYTMVMALNNIDAIIQALQKQSEEIREVDQ